MQAPAVVNVNVPAGALPVPVLIAILFVFGGLAGYALYKATAFKSYAQDFPGQKATVIFGLGWGTYIVLIAGCRLALGMIYPGGYGDIAVLIGAVLGVGGAWGASKHFSSPEYNEGKAKIEAAKAGASPPQVNVTGDATVNANATQERPIPAPSRSTDKPVVPKAGVVATDPSIVAAMQGIAAAQKDPRLPSPLDDERDA